MRRLFSVASFIFFLPASSMHHNAGAGEGNSGVRADTAATSVDLAEVVAVTVKVVIALVSVTWCSAHSPATLKKVIQ